MIKENPAENVLLPGREYPQPDERQVAEDIVKLLQDQMLRFYDAKRTKQLRQIHPKMNGCVKAQFIVGPNIADELKVGLFKTPATYPAWIRLSNGNTKPLPDWKKDMRGFAIKLMNVPGEKLGGVNYHDFILMNIKGFVAGSVKQFGQILKVLTTPVTISNVFSKFITLLSNIPILARAAKAKNKINNPCEIPYFSTVPFRFGDETKAVKYGVFPSPDNHLDTTTRKSVNLLRENLAATLIDHELYFDFCVQFQTDPVKMPVEDPTVPWTSAFHKVATIRIPAQSFDTPEQNDFGDNLSFNTWNSLPEHRPLGNFNRVRRIIYVEMYKFRHAHNQIAEIEPEACAAFFNNTKCK